MEGPGQTANDFESEALPQPNRAFVGADHKIELHGAKASGSRVIQRMGAHSPGNAAPLSPVSRDISAVRDMRAPAALIRPQKVRSQGIAAFLSQENLVAG